MFVLLLSGCSGGKSRLDRAMKLRADLLGSGGCAFTADITADYGDKSYSFTLDCQSDSEGNVTFSVVRPETIAGISGTVSERGGKLTFDDAALDFGLLADGQVSPVSAPWILVHTLRSGYLTSCGEEDGFLRISIDDSYEEDALHLDVWLNESELPSRTEIVWQDRMILSMEVRSFGYV